MSGLHSKNLFLKDKKGRLFLVSARDDARIDLKRLHEAIGASGRLSFCSAELLMEKLGVTPGSVTAFAVINDRQGEVTMVLDANLMTGEDGEFPPADQHRDAAHRRATTMLGLSARRRPCADDRRFAGSARWTERLSLPIYGRVAMPGPMPATTDLILRRRTTHAGQ